MKHGEGCLYYKNGDVYMGDFLYNKESGFGYIQYFNGNTYKGNFENG